MSEGLFLMAPGDQVIVITWLHEGRRDSVGPMEAIDGTPVVDIKPALPCRQ